MKKILVTGGFGFIGNLIKGLFGGILSGLKNLFSMILGPLLINMVSLLIKGGLIIGIMTLIGKYFLDKDFRDSVNKMVVDLWNGITPEFKNQLSIRYDWLTKLPMENLAICGGFCKSLIY